MAFDGVHRFRTQSTSATSGVLSRRRFAEELTFYPELAVRSWALLNALPRYGDNDIVFVAPRGSVLSDMSLTAVMRRMEIEAVPHGFRSTFRDWAAERTNYPREVAEMALAHTIQSKVEAAYRRGDLFEKRSHMMREWAEFCGTATTSADVVPINRASAA